MAEKNISLSNFWLSFLGTVGALAIFALILFVAYLPNRAEPVDAQVAEERRQNADETIAAGNAKLEGYAVVNAETGTVRIPIEQAMELTLRDYNSAERSKAGTVE